MIIFDLNCENSHRFEGWFASPGDFEQQLAEGMIRCPACNSRDIHRVPSVIHLTSVTDAPVITTATIGKSPVPEPRHSLAIYHQLVTALVSSSEDVGASFAEEARRIYYNEAAPRSIHGQSSDDEFQELLEEGIEVWRLPLAGKDELN